MAIGDITGTIDSHEFDTSSGMEPYIAHCSGELYAIVYGVLNAAAGPITRIKTVKISSAGVITSTGHSLDCDVGTWSPDMSVTPCIAHVSGNVYAITYGHYEEFDDYFVLRTVTINDSTGAIAQTGHSWNFLSDDVIQQRMPIIPISGDMYAIVHPDSSYDGWIRTVAINGSTGAITPTGHTLEFDPIQGWNVTIIHISGDMYAIPYQGPGNDGWIKTITISDAGVIALTGESLEFDTVFCTNPDIIHIAGNMYAIAYVGSGDTVTIKTITINSSTGAIASTGESLGSEANADSARIAHVADDIYAIEYVLFNGNGKVITVTINSSSGAIVATGESYTYDTNLSQGPPMRLAEFTYAVGDAYAAVYTAHGSDGWLKTIGIVTSEAVSAARHRFTGGMMHRPVH